MGKVIKNKYTECPQTDVGYEQDCALKRALKRLFNDHPGNFKIKDVEFTDRMPLVDPEKTYDVYMGIKFEVEIQAEYFFTLQGKMRKTR